MDQEDVTDQLAAASTQPVFLQTSAAVQPTAPVAVQTKWISSNSEELIRPEKHSNGTWEHEALVPIRSPSDDSLSAFPSCDLSLPEVCVSSNKNNSFEDDMNYEVQQAFKIFSGFLLDKHKAITVTFFHPIGQHDAQDGTDGVQGQVQSQLRQSMCMRRIEEKFANQEYENITEFVADFRLMLENCYRYYGVDHWISKQAQKLEIILEQKLTLLSRVLREKTSLAVTSKGRFGAEEDRGSGGTSTRRRQASRYLATITGGGHESVLVRTLRLEEQQRIKEEKRQRELEKKEAEEMSAKEVEEWEEGLLSQAAPHSVGTLWELPAIGHFLCLAQTALNLPEIVFFELERCLLMPRSSQFLSKVMSSLLSPPQKRASLERRPSLPYRRWESELRQRVTGWYRAVGASHNQSRRAEQLGLCHQFFSVLGAVSPLEDKPFHLLPFYQRVWLLKVLCDHVYETQKDVQDAVLSQPIHECRESILGYDSKENAYIHFPHFCGADLRIYCQSPSAPSAIPFPSVLVRRVETKPGTEGSDQKDACTALRMVTDESSDFGKKTMGTLVLFKKENGNGEEDESRLKSPVSHSESSDSDLCEDSKQDLKKHIDSLLLTQGRNVAEDGIKVNLKEEISDEEQTSSQVQVFSFYSEDIVKAEMPDPCLNVAEHSYTGRSASYVVKLGANSTQGQTSPCFDCLKRNICDSKSPDDVRCCSASRPAACFSTETTSNIKEERADDKIWSKKKKRKKKRAREQLSGVKREQKDLHSWRPPTSQAAMSVVRKVTTTIKRKDKKKKYKTENELDSLKKMKEEPPSAPSFKLVCSSLDELRELISKTEDELDELESMKKRLGRWYYKKEAVKELHSTLIRLLNELLPWEPKLVKAFQRNRLRLKKEYDDFKKHPEYNNFVREECITSSSSSSDDDGYEEKEVEKIHCRDLEEEDQEHVVPRGLWSGVTTKESGGESAEEKTATSAPSNHSKHPLTNKEKGFSLLPGCHDVFTSVTPADCKTEAGSGLISTDKSGDLPLGNTLVAPASPILNPMCKLPLGYTPIPTLLAKSVGNKVTLMKRPTDFPCVFSVDRQLKGSAGVSPTLLKALPKTPQATRSQNEPKSPVQVVCRFSEGVGHLGEKESSSPLKHQTPVLDKNTVETVMHQVVILPSTHLVQKGETKAPFRNQQQSNLQVPVSKMATPVCISTDVPGFSIPDGKIPVQQVAPLTDAQARGNPTSSGSPSLQQRTQTSARPKGPQVCSVKASTLKGGPPSPSVVNTSTKAAAAAETVKFTEPKQELKTVCIRDSQSILVTTRGGNTGIVKVQTSSEQNSLGPFPARSVITISPQLKAFLVSKTSSPHTDCGPSYTSLPTVQGGTSTSVAQTQKHNPTVLTALHTVSLSSPTAVTSSAPISRLAGKMTGTAAALSRGSCISPVSSVVTKISQPVNMTSCSSPLLPSTSKNKVAVRSLSSSGVSKVSAQETIRKTGVKRSSTDDISQVTKYILVTPSSPSSSNQHVSKGTPSSPQPAASSRVVRVSQPAVTTSTTFIGSNPKQMMGAGSGQALTTPLSSPAFKMGLSPAESIACVSSEVSSKAGNSTHQAGVAVQRMGKTIAIGQTVGALSNSPSKASTVSVSGTYSPTAASTTGMVPITNLLTITNCSPHLDTLTTLPFGSLIQGIPSTSLISQTSVPSSTSSILPAESMKRKELFLPAATLSCRSPAQVTTTLGNCPAQQSSTSLYQKPLHSKRGLIESGSPALSSSQTLCNKTHPPHSYASPTLSTSTTGPVTQKIIINTSTHLTAGTQIVLNNSCFLVPPQGLGPGSHVLLISNPPSPIPAVTSTSAEALLPPKGTIVTPQASDLSQHAARLPSMPSAGSQFVACAGQSLLEGIPHVTPFRLTGPSGLGSSVISSKTNVVSALPQPQPAPVCTSTFISSPPKLGTVPVLGSLVKTTSPSPGSALTTTRVTGGLATQANFSSTLTSTSLSRLSGPLSSLPGVLSSRGASPSPVIPVTAALHGSPSAQRVGAAATVGSTIHPEQTVGKVVTSSNLTQQGLVQAEPGRMSRKTTFPVVQPVRCGALTQDLPKVAVPPILSSATRTQALPIATVPPIGSSICTFEMASAAMVPPLRTTTPPVISLMPKSTNSPPVILIDQSFETNSTQTLTLGTPTNLPPKLLTSTDGGVLSSDQREGESTRGDHMPQTTGCSGGRPQQLHWGTTNT